MLRPRGSKERKERQAALAARFDAEPLVAGGSVVVYRGAFGLADWGIQRQQLPIKVTTTIIEGGDHRWSPSTGRGEARELTLQRVDLREIAAGVVIAAPLAAHKAEAATGVRIAGSAPAQVDDRGEILPLLQ
jgi:hypothetical protein